MLPRDIIFVSFRKNSDESHQHQEIPAENKCLENKVDANDEAVFDVSGSEVFFSFFDVGHCQLDDCED